MTETQTQSFGAVSRIQSAELAAVAVAAAAKAEVESAYVVAMKQPRNEDDARVQILAACRNPSFAQKARYAKPVGAGKVEGPSIRFAEEALRHWGNVLSQQSTIYDDDHRRILKVTVRDLESNLNYSTEVTLDKTVERKNPSSDREVIGERANTTGGRVFIVKATEDELLNKQNAYVSKLIRNNGLRLIPDDIVDEAMRTARETILNQIKGDPDAERNALLDQFGKIGVMPSAIETYLGSPVAQMTPAQMVGLRDILTAIKDGQATWAEYVTPKEPIKNESAGVTPTPASLSERLKAKATNWKAAEPPPISQEELNKEADRAIEEQDAEQEYRKQLDLKAGHSSDLNTVWKEIVADKRIGDEAKGRLYGAYSQSMKTERRR